MEENEVSVEPRLLVYLCKRVLDDWGELSDPERFVLDELLEENDVTAIIGRAKKTAATIGNPDIVSYVTGANESGDVLELCADIAEDILLPKIRAIAPKYSGVQFTPDYLRRRLFKVQQTIPEPRRKAQYERIRNEYVEWIARITATSEAGQMAQMILDKLEDAE